MFVRDSLFLRALSKAFRILEGLVIQRENIRSSPSHVVVVFFLLLRLSLSLFSARGVMKLQFPP